MHSLRAQGWRCLDLLRPARPGSNIFIILVHIYLEVD
jgi:hypothetical protein